MKEAIKKMQALQLELDDIISTREEIFDNKSANW